MALEKQKLSRGKRPRSNFITARKMGKVKLSQHSTQVAKQMANLFLAIIDG